MRAVLPEIDVNSHGTLNRELSDEIAPEDHQVDLPKRDNHTVGPIEIETMETIVHPLVFFAAVIWLLLQIFIKILIHSHGSSPLVSCRTIPPVSSRLFPFLPFSPLSSALAPTELILGVRSRQLLACFAYAQHVCFGWTDCQ